MPLPAPLHTVTVADQFLGPDDSPLSGSITFTPAPAWLTATAGSIIGGPVTVHLDATGAFSVALLATDEPSVNPVGWTYVVKYDIPGLLVPPFALALPLAAPSVVLGQVAPVSPSGGAFTVVTGPAGPVGPTGATGPSGGGGSAVVTRSVRVTDDNLSGLPSAASWVVVQTSGGTKLQCSIPAVVGDRIKVHAGFMRSGSHFLDWVLLDNAGAIAEYAGTLASGPLPEGDPDLYPSLSFGFMEMVEMFTITSGNILAGNVTVGLAHQGTGTGIVYAHTTYPFKLRLENMGPEPA
jgi:hypothetical protein